LGDQQLDTDLQRKAMSKLVGLQFQFQYKRGVENGAADALSRVGQLLSANALSFYQPQWLLEVTNSYETDDHAQTLLPNYRSAHRARKDFSLSRGIIRLHNGIWIGSNTTLQTKLISAFHQGAVGGHSGIAATYQRVKKLFA
jgi:hypothetical protein